MLEQWSDNRLMKIAALATGINPGQGLAIINDDELPIQVLRCGQNTNRMWHVENRIMENASGNPFRIGEMEAGLVTVIPIGIVDWCTREEIARGAIEGIVPRIPLEIILKDDQY